MRLSAPHVVLAVLAASLAGSATAASSLPPLAWAPLPYGTVSPGGWLARQLRIQGDGMSGHFQDFWGPVANSTWTGGINHEGGEAVRGRGWPHGAVLSGLTARG